MIILQNTQTIQLFTKIIITGRLMKVNKIPRWKARVQRHGDLMKLIVGAREL